MQHIPALTSFRGVAALLVVLFHVHEVSDRITFFGKGYLWVDLFFILSGYVIAMTYGETFARSVSRKDAGRFLWARFSRIYPLHGVILLAFVLFEVAKVPVYLKNPAIGAPPFTGIYAPDKLLGSLTLMHAVGFFDANSWNFPSWSIGAEFIAYLLFPFIAFVIARRRRYALMLGAVAITGLTSIFFVKGSLDATYDLGAVRGVCGFTLGVLMFHAGRGSSAFWRSDTAVWLTFGGVVLCLAFAVPDILVIPVFCALVLAAGTNKGAAQRLFAMPAVVYLGEISYSIYLTHRLVIAVLERAGKVIAIPTPGWLLIPLLTVAVSALTYAWIEKPARHWLRQRFFPRSADAPVAAVS